MRYAKSIVAVLAAAAVVAQAALSDGTITTGEWLEIIFAALGAVGVWAVPNRQPAPASPDPAEGSGTNPSTRMRSRVSQDRPPDVPRNG